MSEPKQNEQQGHQGDAAKEKTERPLSQTEPAEEETAESLKIGLHYETEYIAPLRRYDGSRGPPLIPNNFSVTLHSGHTLAKHWEAIGEDLHGPGADDWYQMTLTEEQLERIRQDPGVKKVTQSGKGVWG